MKTRFFIILGVLLQMSALGAKSRNVSINARFEPNKVRLGKEVRYIVDITNATPDDFILPPIKGLYRRGESVYQSTNVINGTISEKISYIFSFIPETIGTFEMPEYEIMINGKPYPIMSSKVTVKGTANNTPSPEQNQSLDLNVTIYSPQIYVGQGTPVTISVKHNRHIQLTNNIKAHILNDAFIQSSLSKQAKPGIEGKYETYSWDTFITPLKSGKEEVLFKVICPIQVKRSMGFFSFMEEDLVNLTSKPISIEVLALPEASPHFSGGIGKFTLSNFHLSSDRALLGEPITLSVDVAGEGNFSRLHPPEIASSELWKVFPPKSTFVAQDDYDFRGVKTIEYIIIPQKTGELVAPDITLTYFNPETKCYELSTIDDLKKTILVSRSTESFPDQKYDHKTSIKNKINNTKNTESVQGEIHILSNDTKHYRTLMPIYFQSWFWIFQGFLLVIAALSLLKMRILTIKKKAPKWNTKNVQKILLKLMDKEDARQFYRTALEIIDQKLALWGIQNQNHSEQIRQLQAKEVKHLKWLEFLWNEADAIAFGQSQVDKTQLKNHLEKLLMFLNQK